MKMHKWGTIPKEQTSPTIARQAIHASNMTVARIHLAKGAVVPEHSHPSEQLTTLVEGKLLMRIGGVECVAEAGDMVEIPPDVPHSVEVLEESVAVDVFAPRRDDWLRGDDAYMRK
jgi:quercetin dioxygenase-like cupin family protein